MKATCSMGNALTELKSIHRVANIQKVGNPWQKNKHKSDKIYA